MKVSGDNKLLYLNLGLFFPDYHLKVADILRWEFVAEENGATYLAFVFQGSTQHVSLPSIEPDELHEILRQIEEILGMKPELHISELRISMGQLCQTAEITVGLLGFILATASF
ncbi:hypothetical protein [Hahella ganghwensis]|uniref:hypothetical protein n=1 Tax=Hahella ganghwensis TaxID=286420 RepID=UPI00036610AB|nr:hypothetical protein [Hahella ganghwensis]